MCLHDSIASQCVAARQKEKEKALLPLSPSSILSGSGSTGHVQYRFRNMNYNNLVMQLRKLCNHPFLVLEDVRSIPDELYFRDLLAASGKLVVLDRLLDELLDTREQRGEAGGDRHQHDKQQHKVLIFSQMTTMLDILQGFLHGKGLACFRLDGGTDRLTRDHIIGKFFDGANPHHQQTQLQNGDEEKEGGGVRVFLLSTRAGE